MTMDPKQFNENLFLYGADLNEWPEEIRQAGVESLRISSELQALLAEGKKFELVLKTRKYEEPGGNLIQKIVSLPSTHDKKSPPGFGLFFPRLFADEFYFPKPAFVLASSLTIAALVVGFVIGFSNSAGSIPTGQSQAYLQEFLHYQEGGLWAKK
jgi:hypothetical protein